MGDADDRLAVQQAVHACAGNTRVQEETLKSLRDSESALHKTLSSSKVLLEAFLQELRQYARTDAQMKTLYTDVLLIVQAWTWPSH